MRLLKTLLNYHKMETFPGSSTVEHSAVNRNVGGSNPPRGAKFSSFSHLQTRLFLLRSECHNSLRVFEAKNDKHFAKPQCFREKNNWKCADHSVCDRMLEHRLSRLQPGPDCPE